MSAERRPLLSPVARKPQADPTAYNTPWLGNFLEVIGSCFGCCCMFASCGCCCNPYKTVQPGHRGIVNRFGRIRDVLDPGMVYVNPFTEELIPVNMMTHVKSLDSQEVLTKDNIPLTIDGDVFWRRTDPVASAYSITNLTYSIDQIAHAALRDVFGHFELNDCLTHRDEVSGQMQNLVASQVAGWGIIIESIRIRDIRVPKHIMELLASAATAKREAAAMLIKAEANVTAAKSMREAADLLSTPAAMQMRALEVYERIGLNENSKLIFLPADGRINPTINVGNMQ